MDTKSQPSQPLESKLVWGLPVRVFHWSLVVLLGISFYTGEFGDFDTIDYHMWAGYGLLTLVLFRLSFGFISRGNTRFSNFIRGPRAIRRYLNQPTETVGHNPMGALGIIALLLSVTVQFSSGLFVSDDIFVDGPLHHLVSDETSGLLRQVHAVNKWLLLALIAMHLIAIAVHEWRLGHRLLLPMLSGKKKVAPEVEADQHQFGRALICLGVAGIAAYLIVNKI